MIRSREIGHGGGGVRPNADGPRPRGRWIERLEIVIRSDMAADDAWWEVRRKSGEWRGRSKSGLKLIHFYGPPPGWLEDGGCHGYSTSMHDWNDYTTNGTEHEA